MSCVSYVEEVLFEAPLPSFLSDFKTIVLQAVVPRLQSAIQYTMRPEYAEHSLVITLLTCIVLLQFCRSVLVMMVRDEPVQMPPPSNENLMGQVKALQKQVENLKKEISVLIELEEQMMLEQGKFDSVLESAREFTKKAYGCANQRVDRLVEKTLSSLVGILKLFKSAVQRAKHEGEAVAISHIAKNEGTDGGKEIIPSRSMIEQTEFSSSSQRDDKIGNHTNGEESVNEKDYPQENATNTLSSHLSEPAMRKATKVFRPPAPSSRGRAPPPPPLKKQ